MVRGRLTHTIYRPRVAAEINCLNLCKIWSSQLYFSSRSFDAGCLIQIIADVVENLIKAPFKALLWASGKPYKAKDRDIESQ